MTSFRPICIHAPVFCAIPPHPARLPLFLLPPHRVRLLRKQKARESTLFFPSSCCMGSWKDLESFSLLSHFIVFFSIFPFSPLPSLCFLLFSHCFGQCPCLVLIYSYYGFIFQDRMTSTDAIMEVLNYRFVYFMSPVSAVLVPHQSRNNKVLSRLSCQCS